MEFNAEGALTQHRKIGVVILCGGQATRMGAVCEKEPKALLPIGGKPILDWILDFFCPTGWQTILASGHHSNILVKYLYSKVNSCNVKILTEPSPLGTGGALFNAIRQTSCEHIWVLNADTICDYSFVFNVLNDHLSNSALATQVTTLNSNQNSGKIVVSEGKVITSMEGGQLHSSSGSNGIQLVSSTGCYLFKRTILETMRLEKFSLEMDLVPALAQSGRLFAFQTNAIVFDIGTPERYEEAKKCFDEITMKRYFTINNKKNG